MVREFYLNTLLYKKRVKCKFYANYGNNYLKYAGTQAPEHTLTQLVTTVAQPPGPGHPGTWSNTA